MKRSFLNANQWGPRGGGPIGQTWPVRYLTVVRHAKAVAALTAASDFDRVLSPRGLRECERLRAWAKDSDELGRFGPTTALVSGAARTRETFVRSFDETSFCVQVQFSEQIYNGRRDVTGEDLLANLVAMDPLTTSLLIVGHNPTVHEFMYLVAAELPAVLRGGHFPLGGVFVLAIDDDQVSEHRRYDVVASYDPH